jgi:hypothetical protein
LQTTAQNAVQVGRGGYDIAQNGPNWANGLLVGTGLLGLGGNYATWQRLPRNLPNVPWSYGLLSSDDLLGETDKFGNITIRPGLSGQALIDTVRHESVHRFSVHDTDHSENFVPILGCWATDALTFFAILKRL